MSHTVAIKTEFKNWNILTKTLENLGWTLKQNSKLRTYPSDPQRNTVYEWIAVNPDKNGYDVALRINADESIDLLCDTFGGSIERTLGNQFRTLKKEYVINVAKNEFEEVEILKALADGSLILEVDDGL
jgi:hypothetical protein